LNPILLALALVAAEESATAPTENEAEVASGLQQEGVQKAKFNEIERGFSVRLPIGMMHYLTPVRSTAGGFDKRYLPGLVLGVELGYDILPIFDISAFFYFSNNQGTGTGVVRDLNSILGGLMVHVSFFHTQRFYMGVKAGVGYGMQDTSVERLQHGVAVVGALTFEYFTRIRHFSVALDAGVVVWPGPTPFSLALTVIPAVRYTF
jgi:hypothetical protein